MTKKSDVFHVVHKTTSINVSEVLVRQEVVAALVTLFRAAGANQYWELPQDLTVQLVIRNPKSRSGETSDAVVMLASMYELQSAARKIGAESFCGS